MKAQHILFTCTSIMLAAVASSSIAWAALSCDTAGDVSAQGDSEILDCLRYSDDRRLGQGSFNNNIPTVRWEGQGRDLTVFGFNAQGAYIDGCYAQTIKNVTANPAFGPQLGCAQDVRSMTLLGKDDNTF